MRRTMPSAPGAVETCRRVPAFRCMSIEFVTSSASISIGTGIGSRACAGKVATAEIIRQKINTKAPITLLTGSGNKIDMKRRTTGLWLMSQEFFQDTLNAGLNFSRKRRMIFRKTGKKEMVLPRSVD